MNLHKCPCIQILITSTCYCGVQIWVKYEMDVDKREFLFEMHYLIGVLVLEMGNYGLFLDA